jgi:hypothetical protein
MGANDYFDMLRAHPNHWKSWSLRRPEDVTPTFIKGGPPYYVTYDPDNDTYPLKQDAAKVTIVSTKNSLITQGWYPLNTVDGHTYLITWDMWFPPEVMSYLMPPVQNWKTIQLRAPNRLGGHYATWFETQTNFQFAPLPTDVAKLTYRTYGYSVKENYADVVYGIKPATWNRYWTFIDQTSGLDTMAAWIADENRDPINTLIQHITDCYGGINYFNLEFNTSMDPLREGRPDYCVYIKNIAVLQDLPSYTSLLQRPMASGGIGIFPPSLVSPAQGATFTSIHDLVWSGIGSPDLYHLQVATDSGFASPLIDEQALTGTTYTPVITPGTYYWHVRSHVGSDWSAWSAINSFTLEEGEIIIIPDVVKKIRIRKVIS